MNTLLIRHARQQDMEQIILFNQAMAMETENKKLNSDTLKAGVENLFLQPQYGFYCVAELDGRVIGQLMITYEWSDWRNGLFWWIQSVYIDPEFRRLGVYRKLYDFILNDSKKHTVCGLRLYVDKDNLAAKKAYLKCGMEASHYDLFETDYVLG